MLTGTSSLSARLIALLLAATAFACATPNVAPRALAEQPPFVIAQEADPNAPPDPNGFYVGGVLGFAAGRSSDSEFENDLAPTHVTRVDLDDNGLGWRLFGLYRFLDYLGIELGFTQLKVPDSTIQEIGGPNASLPADVRDAHPLGGYGGTLAAKFFTPEYNRVSAYGQVGLWYWAARIDVDIAPGGGGPTSSSTIREEGLDFYGGVGLLIDAGEGFHFQLGWDRYFLDGDGVDFFSGGLTYGF